MKPIRVQLITLLLGLPEGWYDIDSGFLSIRAAPSRRYLTQGTRGGINVYGHISFLFSN